MISTDSNLPITPMFNILPVLRSLLVLVFAFALLVSAPLTAQVLPGIDVLVNDNFSQLQGKKVGLVINQTAVRRNVRQTTLDAFLATDQCTLAALYAPEHGIDGAVLAGDEVSSQTDPTSGLTVYSLYGATKKPTKWMMRDIDVMVYDIQDIGVRSYTYISTLLKAMEGCAEAGIPLVVLDRPNPIGADVVDGPVLDPAFKSFVGIAPLPYVYGLTVGELALMANSEGWLPGGLKCDLSVISMDGYRRWMSWRETGLLWIPTSPHIPKPESPFANAVTGAIGEIGIISIGIGYTLPFELIGATWMDGRAFAARMNGLGVPGIHFRSTSYKPFYGMSTGKVCGGVQIVRTGERAAPFSATVALMTTIRDMYPEQKLFDQVTPERWEMFDKVCGTDQIRKRILAGESYESIAQWWQPGLRDFISRRQQYLLYE